MTRRTRAPYIDDPARGVMPDAVPAVDVDHHLRACSACARLLEEQRAMSASLRRLADDVEDPPPLPRTEQNIVAAFDAAWAPAFRRRRPWRRLAAAAVIVVAASVAWFMARSGGRGVQPGNASNRSGASQPAE